MRARVVKALHSLLKVDSGLIDSRSSLQDAIKARLNDIAISVREEAVKLIGSFILNSSTLSGPSAIANNNYIDELLVRSHDIGVSVRNRLFVYYILYDTTVAECL